MLQTKQQKLAKSIDRHLSVTANAGSGKTTVLVDRYLRLITEPQGSQPPVDPKYITAITFTNLASSEMTERLVSKLNKKIEEAQSENEIIELTDIRTKLSNAKISTIHSFCAKILRDYPIEAGVSPNFIELSGADLYVMQKQAIAQTLDDRLFSIGDGEDNNKYNELKELIFALGSVKQVENYLMLILNKRTEFYKASEVYDDESTYIDLKRYNFLKINFLSSLEKLQDLLIIVTEIGAFSAKSKISVHQVDILISNLKSYIASLSNAVDDEIKDTLNIVIKGFVCQFDNKFFTKKNELTAVFKKIIEDSQIQEDIEYSYNSIIKLIEATDAQKYETEQLKYSKIMLELGREAIENYSNEKKLSESLDFDDLMIITNNLLSNPDSTVLNAIRQKIKYLMVDEFQDTDSLQYSIIKKLISDLGNSRNDYINNIFIVGDPKQSIYGFRGADVRVFADAKKDIFSSNRIRYADKQISEIFSYQNEQIQAANENEILGNITLPATFRTKPDISTFVNKVCDYSFSLSNSDFSIEYEHLISAKDANDFYNYIKNNDTDNDIFRELKGNVDILLKIYHAGQINFAEEVEKKVNYNYLDIVADYIAEKVNTGQAQYGDFAVLNRAGRNLNTLSIKLIERGIPFVNHSGGGFFNIPEIIDIINLLKFITDNNDDAAFLTVLKSSFCGFNNTDLYIISQMSKNENYFKRMKMAVAQYSSGTEKHTEDFKQSIEKFSKVNDILDELISYKLELNVALILIKAIERFNWYNVINNSPFAIRIKANTEKFLELSRTFVKKGFKNIYDFIAEIEFARNNSIAEAEAVIISDIDQVNLMTIHASKGLEFKNVIILEANSSTTSTVNKNNSIIFDEEFGCNFPFNTIGSNGKMLYNAKSGTYIISGWKNIEKNAEEEKRIMYVAMTRAIQKLILAANLHIKKPKDNGKEDAIEKVEVIQNSLLYMALKAFQINNSEFLQKHNHQCRINVPLLREINGKFVNDAIDYNFEFQILRHYHNNDYQKTVNTSLISATKDENSGCIPNILDSSIEGEFISATRMMNYEHDKDGYILKYILGLPEDESKNKYADEHLIGINEAEEEEILSPKEFGIAVHYVFENIADWYQDGKILTDRLNEITQFSINNNSKKITGQKEEIIRIAENVVNSHIFADYNKYLKNAQAEYNLYYKVGNDFINGIIDLLIQDNDGNYEIWDWKTNKINNNLEQLGRHYEQQMKLYSYFLYKLRPNQDIYKSKLLFVRQSNNSDNLDDWIITYRWNREDLVKYESELNEIIGKIKNYPFLINN